MKLIIDIPEETKQAFDKAESNDLKGGYYDHGGVIGKAIQNGIPLDDVKAEIAQFREDLVEKAPSLMDLMTAHRTVDICLGIIDKHIKGRKRG